MKKIDELLINAAVKMGAKRDKGSMTIEILILVIVLAVLAIVFKSKLRTSTDSIFSQFDGFITNNVFKEL